MLFLIEVNFRKGSKPGTMLSNKKKVRKLRHLCCKIDEIHPFFLQLHNTLFQRSGEEILVFKNFRGVNKK